MAKVLGVGGVFFKAADPQGLAHWYARWLGLEIEPSFTGAFFRASSIPAGGGTVWSPFQSDTTYFEPSSSDFMINLMVDDLDAALRQVSEGGATLVGDPSRDELGCFGWFLDPEGNKVELWQPPETAG